MPVTYGYHRKEHFKFISMELVRHSVEKYKTKGVDASTKTVIRLVYQGVRRTYPSLPNHWPTTPKMTGLQHVDPKGLCTVISSPEIY